MKASTRLFTSLVLLALSSASQAHTGHGAHAEGGFMSGLLHPVLGSSAGHDRHRLLERPPE